MPETALARQSMLEDGVTPTANNADDTNGNSIPNPDGKTMIRVENKNGAAASGTVTVSSQQATKALSGRGLMSRGDAVVALADGAVTVLGPFKQDLWNDSSGNLILSYTGTAAPDLDVEIFTIPEYLA